MRWAACLLFVLALPAEACTVKADPPALEAAGFAMLVELLDTAQQDASCAAASLAVTQELLRRPALQDPAWAELAVQVRVAVLPRLLELGRPEEALDQAKQALEGLQGNLDLEPATKRSLQDRAELALGESLIHLGRPAEAAEALSRLARRLAQERERGLEATGPIIEPLAWHELSAALQDGEGLMREAFQATGHAISLALRLSASQRISANKEIVRWIGEWAELAPSLGGSNESIEAAGRMASYLEGEATGDALDLLPLMSSVRALLLVKTGRHQEAAEQFDALRSGVRAGPDLPGNRSSALWLWWAGRVAKALQRWADADALGERAIVTLRALPERDRDRELEADWLLERASDSASVVIQALAAGESGLTIAMVASAAGRRVREALPLLEAGYTASARSRLGVELKLLVNEARAAQLLCASLSTDEGLASAQRSLARMEPAAVPGLRLALMANSLSLCHALRQELEQAVFWQKLGERALQQLLDKPAPPIRRSDALLNGLAAMRKESQEATQQLLVLSGRLEEAQLLRQVEVEGDLLLNTRSLARPTSPTPVPLTLQERSAAAALMQALAVDAALAARLQQLSEIAQRRALSTAEAQETAALRATNADQRARALADFSTALAQALQRSGRDLRSSELPAGIARQGSRLRVAVDRWRPADRGTTVAGLQVLQSADRLTLILTPHGALPLAHTVQVSRADFDQTLNVALLMLRSPASTPTYFAPLLRKLYDLIFQPLEADLARHRVGTILLALGGKLQLMPFAALMDADGRYLLERYRFTHFLEEATEIRPARRVARQTVLALGASTFPSPLPNLPHVEAELRAAVAHAESGGRIVSDEGFGRDRFRELLATDAARGFNTLHLATHFVIVPDRLLESHLVLGRGETFSLADLLQPGIDLSRFDVVVLSTCDSARALESPDRETRSLTALAQRLGAGTVVGNLWRVDDEGAALIMRQLYRQRPGQSRGVAEALRTAQRQMLRGEVRMANGRSLSHPFYWASYTSSGRDYGVPPRSRR